MSRFLTNTYLVLAFFLPGGQHFLFGQTGNPFTITLASNGDSLVTVLHQIEIKYPVKFYVDPSSKFHQVVSSFNFTNTPMGEALHQLLTGTDLGYIEFESYLFIISDSIRLNNNQFNEYFKRKKSIEENAIEYASVIGRPDSINRSRLALIRGKVIDGATDSVLSNMSIKINDLDTTLISDRRGNFNIVVPVGIHELTIESDAFQSFQQTLKVYSDGAIVIKLFANAFSLPEVVIGGSAQRRLENAVAGVAELTIKEIKRLPSLLGETDVLKALLTLPGVSNTGEVGSGYNVRGGNIDQNLILQEGAFHLNPTHVLGLFSAFNPDAIKNVTLYKGYIPAQYGGRTSSVLNIKLKDPDYKKWSVFGGIGPISSKIFLEGPIIKDRTSFFIGSRFTYSDWVLKLVRDPNLKNSSAGFNDFNFKLSHRLSNTGTIQLSAYQSNDRFNYAKEFGYGWNSKSVSVLYTQQFKNQLVLSASLIYSDNNSDFNDQTALVKNILENGLVYYKAKLNAGWQIFKTHTLNAGIDAIRYKPKPQIFEATLDQEITHEEINQSQGDEGALYINDEFSILPKLNASFGYRFNVYRNIGPEQINTYEPGKPRIPLNVTGMLSYTQGQTIRKFQGAEPRASLAYILSDQSSLKLAYNRLYQFIHLVSNTAAATPVDIWQLSNAFLAPQSANNFSLGYFKNLNQNEWETSFEVYYKKLENLVEYKDFAKLLRNPHLETELFPVIGKSYGAEISVKRLKNNPTGYISYTLSRSLRKSPGLFPDEVINNGQWYASNFDKPHNLNIVFDLQVRKTMFLSANFVYTTGRPQTAPIADFYLGDGGVFLNYSQRNSLRIPDYHRLDISYTITRGAIRTRKSKGSLTLAIYNFYARKNAFSVFYRRTPNEPLVGYKLAVLGTALPSITYNFQF